MHLPLVKKIAARMASRLPRCVELADLEADGAIGLRQAVLAYDERRGVAFGAFARRRIHGAMLDGIRAMDWVPRLVRSRQEAPKKLVSLDAALAPDGRERPGTLAELVAGDGAGGAVAGVDCAMDLQEMLRPLPRDHRFALTLYYAEAMTMDEIGRAMGISQSRVSQLHSEALSILRSAMSNQRPEPMRCMHG